MPKCYILASQTVFLFLIHWYETLEGTLCKLNRPYRQKLPVPPCTVPRLQLYWSKTSETSEKGQELKFCGSQVATGLEFQIQVIHSLTV